MVIFDKWNHPNTAHRAILEDMEIGYGADQRWFKHWEMDQDAGSTLVWGAWNLVVLIVLLLKKQKWETPDLQRSKDPDYLLIVLWQN